MITHWIADWMRRWADRLDHAGAPKATHLTMTFENRKGLVVHGLDDTRGALRGCRLWYLNDTEYEKAHTEAIDPGVRVNWRTGTVKRPLP